MTLFYSAIVAIAALMIASRIRQWMFEQAPPGATFYFFRRPVLKLSTGSSAGQKYEIEDLDNHPAGSDINADCRKYPALPNFAEETQIAIPGLSSKPRV